MNLFYIFFIFIILIIFLMAGGKVVVSWRGRNRADWPRDLHRRRLENLKEVTQLLKSRQSLTNNDVEHLLGVSNATAWRYLEALEKEGKVKQVGKTGRSVFYPSPFHGVLTPWKGEG